MGPRRDKMFEVLCFLVSVTWKFANFADYKIRKAEPLRAIRARLRHGFPKWQANEEKGSARRVRVSVRRIRRNRAPFLLTAAASTL